jgi:hypothetical protein
MVSSDVYVYVPGVGSVIPPVALRTITTALFPAGGELEIGSNTG